MDPQHTCGTHLGYFHKVVHTDGPEERQTRSKSINVNTASQVLLLKYLLHLLLLLIPAEPPWEPFTMTRLIPLALKLSATGGERAVDLPVIPTSVKVLSTP